MSAANLHMKASYSNARSTKTRIETPCCFQNQHYSAIRMQDPLKQGLKLYTIRLYSILYNIRMQDPLKQGLKLAHAYEFVK